MISRGVIPTEYIQNLTAEQLLPHNDKYYQECLRYIEKTTLTQKNISKKEIKNLALLQIRETQLDGKRAEQRLGSDPSIFIQKLIEKRCKLLLITILLDKFQFSLYAFSLYLMGYAFFIFFFSAWLGYTMSEAFNIPVYFSSIGLLLGFLSVTFAFVSLFYNRQRLELLLVNQNQFFLSKERLNYLWIGSSFAIPYLFFRLQVTISQINLWMLFLVGILGIGLSYQRFIVTNTLPE